MRKRRGVNKEVVSLIALLHDVDDYKLFGMEYAKNLTNARRIMNECGVDIKIQEQVCDALDNICYNKRLKGCFPSTIEGKVVSDAIFPVENMSADDYVRKNETSSVCHIFEKLLKLKDIMLTKSGQEEAKSRHQIVVDFLYHLFDRENI